MYDASPQREGEISHICWGLARLHILQGKEKHFPRSGDALPRSKTNLSSTQPSEFLPERRVTMHAINHVKGVQDHFMAHKKLFTMLS